MEFKWGSDNNVHSTLYPLSHLYKLYTSPLSVRTVIFKVTLVSSYASHLQEYKESSSRTAGIEEVIDKSPPHLLTQEQKRQQNTKVPSKER